MGTKSHSLRAEPQMSRCWPSTNCDLGVPTSWPWSVWCSLTENCIVCEENIPSESHCDLTDQDINKGNCKHLKTMGHTMPADRKVCRFLTNWGFSPDLVLSGWDWLWWLLIESTSLLDDVQPRDDLCSSKPSPYPNHPAEAHVPQVLPKTISLWYQSYDQCVPSRQWVSNRPHCVLTAQSLAGGYRGLRC